MLFGKSPSASRMWRTEICLKPTPKFLAHLLQKGRQMKGMVGWDSCSSWPKRAWYLSIWPTLSDRCRAELFPLTRAAATWTTCKWMLDALFAFLTFKKKGLSHFRHRTRILAKVPPTQKFHIGNPFLLILEQSTSAFYLTQPLDTETVEPHLNAVIWCCWSNRSKAYTPDTPSAGDKCFLVLETVCEAVASCTSLHVKQLLIKQNMIECMQWRRSTSFDQFHFWVHRKMLHVALVAQTKHKNCSDWS